MACSAGAGEGSRNSPRGSGASNGTGAGNGTGGAIGVSGGSGGSISLGGSGNAGGTGPGMGCYEYDLTWEPKIPTVQIVVDRSSSMKQYGLWGPIRDAILPVVQALEADVRFGFVAYTGTKGTPGCGGDSLLLDSVPAALNNYAAIDALYGPLEPPDSSDTPTGPALDVVRDLLAADTVPGDKFVLLVTDGQPDYCDDPNARCPIDGVVRRIQQLYASGIRTLVFGFDGINTSNADEVAGLTWALQSFANAGSGQPVGVAAGMTRVQQEAPELTPGAVVFWDECSTYGPWQTEHTAAGLPQWYPLGTYGAPPGTATVYKPNPTDATALQEEFASVLSGVKSCTFDLAAEIEEGTIKIDLAQIGQVGVWVIDEAGTNTQIPLDQTNGQGWRMASETQLVLEGAACDLWRSKTSKSVSFDFPCEIIIVVPK